jgi:hypothetical protein
VHKLTGRQVGRKRGLDDSVHKALKRTKESSLSQQEAEEAPPKGNPSPMLTLAKAAENELTDLPPPPPGLPSDVDVVKEMDKMRKILDEANDENEKLIDAIKDHNRKNKVLIDQNKGLVDQNKGLVDQNKAFQNKMDKQRACNKELATELQKYKKKCMDNEMQLSIFVELAHTVQGLQTFSFDQQNKDLHGAVSNIMKSLDLCQTLPCMQTIGKKMHEAIQLAKNGHGDTLTNLIDKMRTGKVTMSATDLLLKDQDSKTLLRALLDLPSHGHLKGLMMVIGQDTLHFSHVDKNAITNAVVELLWIPDPKTGMHFIDDLVNLPEAHATETCESFWDAFHSYFEQENKRTNTVGQNTLSILTSMRQFGSCALLDKLVNGMHRDFDTNTLIHDKFWSFYKTEALYHTKDAAGCSALDYICMFGEPKDISKFDKTFLRETILSYHTDIRSIKSVNPVPAYHNKPFFPYLTDDDDRTLIPVIGVKWSCLHLAALAGNKAMLKELVKLSGMSQIEAYNLKTEYTVIMCQMLHYMSADDIRALKADDSGTVDHDEEGTKTPVTPTESTPS